MSSPGLALAWQQAKRTSPVTQEEPMQLSSPPSTPGSQNDSTRKDVEADARIPKPSPLGGASITPKSNRKRSRAVVIKHETDDLPHNLRSVPDWRPSTFVGEDRSRTKKRKQSHTPTRNLPTRKHEASHPVTKATVTPDTSPTKPKNNGYGLTPGQTPYPNWPHPTAEECEEVARLLTAKEGVHKPPNAIPIPSLTVSGCGEVPDVLDALIRTRLSAATSSTNSARAFQGLVAKFGTIDKGVGKGSVDWNRVRLADTKDVFEAIKSGGLADVKSKDIKKILHMVWEENQARRRELVASGSAPGSTHEDKEEKYDEVAKAEADVISLNHLHLLSNDEAFNSLVKYPGIGPKTASCVLLFCLKRPSFAVDTHVFRLCQWLGWIPPAGHPTGLPPGGQGRFAGPTRNSTFAHLEVRIPDHLKYELHQLFVLHGKRCPRCRAITGESSEGWAQGCPIDHLVKRTGARKDATSWTKTTKTRTPKAKSKAKAKNGDPESDATSSELSEIDSDDERLAFPGA